MLSSHSNMISKQFLCDLAYGDVPVRRGRQPTAATVDLQTQGTREVVFHEGIGAPDTNRTYDPRFRKAFLTSNSSQLGLNQANYNQQLGNYRTLAGVAWNGLE
jgi:hypothetical protein